MPHQPPLSGLEELFEIPETIPSEDIRFYPDVSTETLTTHAKWLGLAGEYLVDSLMLRYGLYTTPLPETLPADRLLYHDEVPIRIQVKTTTRLRAGYYHFNVMRGYHRSPAGVRGYADDDFDLGALVVLLENVAKFSANKRASHRILHREIASLRAHPRRSLDHALCALGIEFPARAHAAPTLS